MALRTNPPYGTYLWPLAIVTILSTQLIALNRGTNLYLFSDDAYYYFTIARNTLQHGFPTFDTSTHTNGFQPLWLALLLPLFAISHDAVSQLQFVRILEICMVAATMFLVHRATLQYSFLPKCTLLLLLLVALKGAGLAGMETTLTMFLFALFYFRAGYTDRSTGVIRLEARDYFLLSLLFLSRIDTIFFIAPIVGIDLHNQLRAGHIDGPTIRATLRKLSFLLALPSIYVLLNLIYLNLPGPVSGAVKTMGDFGINTRYLSQIFQLREALRPRLNFVNLALLIAALTFALLLAKRRGYRDQWLTATVLGAWGFIASQVFISKWSAWVWYLYPAFPLIYCGFISMWARLRTVRYVAVPLALMCMMSAYNLTIYTVRAYRDDPASTNDFRIFNKSLAAELNKSIPGQVVAMGDRAGSFAFFYNGAVFQTEGLVEDAKYLAAIRQQNVEGYLRGQPVDFLLEYESDLGSYETAEIEVPRSVSSGGPISRIRVCKSREVMKLAMDPASHSDNVVYLWKWPPC